MLADASTSWADVSKAKPRAARSAIGHTHAGRRPQRGPASGGVGGGATYRLQEAAAEEGSGPGGGRGGKSGRAAASGEMRRVEDGDARR
jgi:hypothetical protein